MHKLLVISALLVMSALIARADSPGMIHYQGRLVLGTNLFSGPVNLVFRMYDAPTGGDAVAHQHERGDGGGRAIRDGDWRT